MCSRLLSRQCRRKLARWLVVVSLLVFSSAYTLLGDGLCHRIGAQIDRAGNRVSDATTMLRPFGGMFAGTARYLNSPI